MPKRESEQVSMSDVAVTYNKRYGAQTVVVGGGTLADAPRIPSGIFPVDFILAGGIPIWRSFCLWGPPGSSKTSLAIKFMAGVDSICWKCFEYLEVCKCKPPLRKRSAYIDVEGALDRSWANDLGLRDDAYMYCLPETGEAAVDIAESMVRADDCGLVVVDSLAMLEPSAELEGAADDQYIGLQARLVSKMFRKVVSRVISERKRGHMIAALFVNQLRAKIGVAPGQSNEEQPSGYAAKFAYSMSLRVGSRTIPKSETDKIDPETGVPRVIKASVKVTKHKLRVLGTTGEFEIVSVPTFQGKSKGTVLDIPTAVSWARKLGYIVKEGNNWKLGTTAYPSLTALMDAIEKSDVASKIFKKRVIDMAKEPTNV
jgi:recombination protein RecA